jgi:PAS domain S-box-containing protein
MTDSEENASQRTAADLQTRLEEAEEVISAIRDYTVDAFVIEDSKGNRVYTLQTADRPYRHFVECMQEGAVTLSLEGNILFCNQRFSELVNVPREGLRGQPLENYVEPELRQLLWTLLREARTSTQRDELLLVVGDSRIPVHASLAPMDLDHVRALCMIVTDLTRQKHYEELQKTQKALRESLEAEHRARKDAEVANQLKDEFLATLSHELRTPLTSIIGWARMLRDRAVRDSFSQRALDAIDRGARMQGQLIEDILDVSRIVTRQLKIDLQPVQMVRIIGSAIDTVRPAIEAKQIRFVTKLDPDTGTVRGDANRLQQAVTNLLSNAVKFTPNGLVEVRLERAPSGIEISVKDTGEGIDPAFLPHVFDRFRQADSTRTRRHSGLGLGLAIVRHLVELHGGTVHAESAGKGHGATFTIRLPIDASETDEITEAQAASDVHSNRASTLPLKDVWILAVDDEADMLELLELILKDEGATVSTASDSADAIRLLEDAWAEGKCPNVVLSDIGMPEEDGIDFIHRVRMMQFGRNIPAVALTAYAGAKDAEAALAAGYQLHIPKPFSPEELRKAIQTVMGNQEERAM